MIQGIAILLGFLSYDIIKKVIVTIYRRFNSAKINETPDRPLRVKVFDRRSVAFYLAFLIFFTMSFVYRFQNIIVIENIEVFFSMFAILAIIYCALFIFFGVKLMLLRKKFNNHETLPDDENIASDCGNCFIIAGVSFLLLLLTLIIQKQVVV